MLGTSRATGEKMTKECAQLHDRLTKLQTDLDEQIHQNTMLLSENGQKQLLIKSKDEEVVSVKAETAKLAKQREQTMKKLKSMEEARAAIESQRDVLKTGAPHSAILCAASRGIFSESLCERAVHDSKGGWTVALTRWLHMCRGVIPREAAGHEQQAAGD